MSNYFEQIEQNFSRIRGKLLRLNPIDWQLCEEWEKTIPLHIVLNSMDEVFKKFSETRRPDKINSLSYFKQAVEKNFAEYASAMIGKNTENLKIGIDPGSPEGDESLMIQICNSQYDILIELAENYENRTDLPESIKIACDAVASELRELHASNEIISRLEDKLSEMQTNLMYPLALNLTDEDRNAIIDEIERENKNRTLDDDSRAKIANKKLYKKYNLPELTLFEF